MKKKLLSLALAMALCLGLTVPALAANPVTLTSDSYKGYSIVLSDVVSEEDVPRGQGFSDHFYHLTTDASVTLQSASQGSGTCMINAQSSTDYTKNEWITKYLSEVNYSYTFTQADLLAINPDFDRVVVTIDFMENGMLGPYYLTFGGGASTDTPADTPTETPTDTPAPAPAGFTDVAADSPFKDAIAWAVEKNITKGTSATTFSPSTTCTHNHILTFLWRANGSPAAEGANDFAKAIAWAKSKGLGDAIDGGAACTRSQTMMYLWKLAGSPAAAANSAFTDVAADADYAQAVAWAVEKGITKGTSATVFGPDATCTRGQIVTFLYRYMGK